MRLSTFEAIAAPGLSVRLAASTAAHRSALLRVALHSGVAIAAASVALSVHPAGVADADLARLLRIMATLKIGMLAAAVVALDWRLRRPVPARLAAAYLSFAWIAAGAVTAMWMLASIGTSALLLHAAGAALMVLAFTDRDFIPAPATARR